MTEQSSPADVTEKASRSVTIYDVAKVAGVAPSTVSRTFARPGRVNAETAEKVRAAATLLGYRANPTSQALASTRTRLLGVMVADVANPFYSTLIRGAQIAASDEGYELLLLDCRESGNRERVALERLVPVVEGFVICSSRMPNSALRSIAKQRPTVVLNRQLGDVSCLVSDNIFGAKAALDLLVGLGHESVVYVAGPEASWTEGVRFRTVRDYGTKLGLRTQKVGPFLPSFEGGLSAARVLLEKQPTAVIAYNDLMAIGVMNGFVQAGLHVPDHVSVLGFDDILMSRLTLPSLTTIAAPIRQMGRTAVGNVVALINGAKPQSLEATVLPVTLKVRGSTAAPHRLARTKAAPPLTPLAAASSHA